MKKKIMHIVQAPGGVERYIKMFIQNTDSSKYDNILVCSFDYKMEEYKNLVSAFEHVNMIRNINLKSDLLAIKNVRKMIKKYSPDIVYLHSSKAGAIGRIADIGMNNKCIYNPHGWAFNMDCSPLKRNIYLYIERMLSHLCDYIIAISDFEKKSAIDNKVCSNEKIKVIYNGIDIESYENKQNEYKLTREELGIPEDAYVIGTVGRLTEQKAPDIFIKAAKKIKKKYPNTFFLMVGDGELRSQTEKLIRSNNLQDSFLITGWVKDPMEYIKLFNQAMLLSRWEGFGLVLPEYMIAKKPIVATNVDAIPNLINDGTNGILVRKDDIEQVAMASEFLIKNSRMSDFLIKNGERIVKEKFNIQRVISEFEAIV